MIPKIVPPDENGATVIIVAVDPFTKWVKAGPLKAVSSYKVTRWVHENLTCRYGVPLTLRADLG